MSADLVAFLEHFRPGGHITFVAIVPDGSTVAASFNGADASDAARWIEAQNRAHGVYFTCNPTAAGLRKKPTKADITAIAAMWADVDPQDGSRGEWLPERHRLLALADELATLSRPPTLIVDSGNGIQPIWLLAEPIEATPEYRAAAEALCTRIEHALGASGTFNVDRLLRCPGTTNFPNARKKTLGRGETEARLLHATWRRYGWRALEGLVADLEANPPQHARPVKPRANKHASAGAEAQAERLGRIPEMTEELRERFKAAARADVSLCALWKGEDPPQGPDQTRSAWDLKLAGALRRHGGFSLEDFAAIASRWTHGKGADGDPRHWERTWAQAGEGDGRVDAWPQPQPLPSGLPAVEPFPLELLPDAFRPWVQDVAERMQVPADYIAVAVMVAAGSVIGRQIGIRPKRRDDWTVIPNLWGAAIGRPGLLKTPALEEALRPIRRLECAAGEAHEEALKVWETRDENAREAKKVRAERIRKQLRSDRSPEGLAHELAADQVEILEPVRQRFMTNNATVEKLGDLLRDNPNGLLIFRDELMGWLRSMEREGREDDRAFYLESWNGSGRFTYDRIGRGTVEIEAACVSVLGSIQPEPLLSYLEHKAWDGAGADGLLQRFQLMVWPDTPTTWRNVDRYPDTAAREHAAAVFQRLASLPTDDDDDIPALRFDAEAQEAFDAWRAKLETRLRNGNLHPAFEAHLAKYRSLLPALGLICQLVDGGGPGSVGLDNFLRAEAWCDYLETHAARIYDALLRADQSAARTLGERIQSADLPSPFRLRDVYRPCWVGLTTSAAAQEAVDVLCDLGWLRPEHAGTTERGGRPTTQYHLNPAVRRPA